MGASASDGFQDHGADAPRSPGTARGRPRPRRSGVMNPLRTLLPAAVVLIVVLSAARAADEKTAGSVEGVVRLDGQPLEKGKVSFHPAKGKAVEATVKDGAYSAKDVPAGKVRVTVEGQGVPKTYGS